MYHVQAFVIIAVRCYSGIVFLMASPPAGDSTFFTVAVMRNGEGTGTMVAQWYRSIAIPIQLARHALLYISEH